VTQQEVIVRVNYHLVLVLQEVLDGIYHPRVVFEAWHHKFLGETVRGDFLEVVNQKFSGRKAPPPSRVVGLPLRTASE